MGRGGTPSLAWQALATLAMEKGALVPQAFRPQVSQSWKRGQSSNERDVPASMALHPRAWLSNGRRTVEEHEQLPQPDTLGPGL